MEPNPSWEGTTEPALVLISESVAQDKHINAKQLFILEQAEKTASVS